MGQRVGGLDFQGPAGDAPPRLEVRAPPDGKPIPEIAKAHLCADRPKRLGFQRISLNMINPRQTVGQPIDESRFNPYPPELTVDHTDL